MCDLDALYLHKGFFLFCSSCAFTCRNKQDVSDRLLRRMWQQKKRKNTTNGSLNSLSQCVWASTTAAGNNYLLMSTDIHWRMKLADVYPGLWGYFNDQHHIQRTLQLNRLAYIEMWVKVNMQPYLHRKKFACRSAAETSLVSCLLLNVPVGLIMCRRDKLNKFKYQLDGCYCATEPKKIKFMSLNTSVSISDMCGSKDTMLSNQIIGVCFTWDIHFCWGVTAPPEIFITVFALTQLVVFQRLRNSRLVSSPRDNTRRCYTDKYWDRLETRN